jgi:protein dithiol:quinone oxidoreductase
MNMLYSRWMQFLAFFFCHELLMAAFYFQYVEFLDPCPLCMIQRYVVGAIGMIFLFNGFHNPKLESRSQKVYDILIAVFGVLGVIVAGRHVYLQHLPKDKVPECGASLDYMVEHLPLGEVFSKVFYGSGECAEVSWTMWGLSMPEWMIVVFACFTLFAGIRFFFKKRSRHF